MILQWICECAIPFLNAGSSIMLNARDSPSTSCHFSTLLPVFCPSSVFHPFSSFTVLPYFSVVCPSSYYFCMSSSFYLICSSYFCLSIVSSLSSSVFVSSSKTMFMYTDSVYVLNILTYSALIGELSPQCWCTTNWFISRIKTLNGKAI